MPTQWAYLESRPDLTSPTTLSQSRPRTAMQVLRHFLEKKQSLLTLRIALALVHTKHRIHNIMITLYEMSSLGPNLTMH